MRSTFKVLFYLKRNKDKDQKVVPVMGRITVNGSIAQFSAKLSVPEMLWEVSGGRAKGRSLEADRINRHLDNIRTQIGKHYQDICDRESYVTAEKVKNAYLGFGEKYRLLLEAFEKFTHAAAAWGHRPDRPARQKALHKHRGLPRLRIWGGTR